MQGQPLYINYGHKSNEELLLGYGFVLPDNKANFMMLTVGAAAREGGTHAPLQCSCRTVHCIEARTQTYALMLTSSCWWSCRRQLASWQSSASVYIGGTAPAAGALPALVRSSAFVFTCCLCGGVAVRCTCTATARTHAAQHEQSGKTIVASGCCNCACD